MNFRICKKVLRHAANYPVKVVERARRMFHTRYARSARRDFAHLRNELNGQTVGVAEAYPELKNLI